MSTTQTTPVENVALPQLPRGNSWAPSLRGIGLATRIELNRRRPTRKGWIFYGIAVGLMVVISVLVAVIAGSSRTSIPLELNILMVLGLGILISTSLAATSINGDSTEGVLAPLQMTRLTAGDIALGKLLASWGVSVFALVSLSPFLIYSYTRGLWSIGSLLIVVAAILFVVLMATAVGLAWSSIAARAIASVALAHLTLGFLMIGTLVLFGVLTPLTGEEVTITNNYRDWESVTEEQANDPAFDYNALPCVESSYTGTIFHTDRLAPLILVNPFVAVTETAPLADPEVVAKQGGGDGVFSTLHMLVASAQITTDIAHLGYDECAATDGMSPWTEDAVEQSQYPRQPWWGLGTYAVLLVGSMVLVVNRLRVPYKKLRGGTRVA